MCKKYIIIILFLLVIIFVTNSERSSGLYIDNGLDQTILHHISIKQKRKMEYNLLNILELPKKPRRIARKALLVKRSAPKFLLNIYKNVLSNEENKSFYDKYEDTEEFDISSYDINIIDQSDFIMTFGAHNPHSGNATKTNRGKRIWFDVSEVPQGEHIISAELRLYQSLGNIFDYNKTYTIALHRVAQIKNGRRIKHYINSANTTTNKEGWITLNISQGLEYWVNHPKENRGLFVAVHDVDYIGHILRPDDIGIVGVSGVPEKQPFMVGFFKHSGKQSKHNRLQRQKRDRQKKVGFSTINIPNNPYIGFNNPRKGNLCNMKTLYISFKDLQWHDWIIAPEGYDAFYCSGECNFPLNIYMNASNHAIVQTLVHLLKPNEVPKPCCVPTKLSPISVLYFLDDSNVVLKKYNNMVVNSCGCY
ncbi:protein 60A-like isoform X1 [Halictus rubicundus]|uniref:protein 60A-like isoform X1 n=1 Tax=Halictus rubicundus TaxID=77578 RepID=UPI004035EAD2